MRIGQFFQIIEPKLPLRTRALFFLRHFSRPLQLSDIQSGETKLISVRKVAKNLESPNIAEALFNLEFLPKTIK